MIGAPEPGVRQAHRCWHCEKELLLPRFPGDRWLRAIRRHEKACGASGPWRTISTADRALKTIFDPTIIKWCYACRKPHNAMFERCPQRPWPWEMQEVLQ